jgi:glycosyltransferase involved in cell wall biosynthesis
MNKHRLLVITDNSPLPVRDGAALRVYNLITNLPNDWVLDLICGNPETEQSRKEVIESFRKVYFVDNHHTHHPDKLKYFHRIKYLFSPPKDLYSYNVAYSNNLNTLIQHVISINTYDAILCFWAVTYGYYLSNYERLNITCDVCDSASLHIRSMAKAKKFMGREWISYYYAYLYNLRWEKKYLNRCEKLITISERDKKWLSKTIHPSKIHVVGNGVDVNYFKPEITLPGTEDGLIVFTGVMDYEPNHDAMIYCLREIWPIIKKKSPEAKLKIVGRNPRPELVNIAREQKNVEVTGEVEDIRQAIKGAKVFLCPMRIGSGMKNKILEALAMGIPVVTTSEGAAGIEFENGRIGFIANDPHSVSNRVITLLKEEPKWKELSISAREITIKKCSWNSIGDKLSDILLAGY